jgi:hypothetical protein
MMWVEDDRVKTITGLFTLEEILGHWRTHKHRSIAVHFRFSTKGSITVDNCHPFKVLDKDEDGVDLYMMHNGSIPGLGERGGKSDTRLWIETYLRPRLLAEGYEVIKKQEVRDEIGRRITIKNKLFFLASDGWNGFVNRAEGHLLGDTWYSNLYSLKKKTPRTVAAAPSPVVREIDLEDANSSTRLGEVHPVPHARSYLGRLDPDDLEAVQFDKGKYRYYLESETVTGTPRIDYFTHHELWQARQEKQRRDELARERESRLQASAASKKQETKYTGRLDPDLSDKIQYDNAKNEYFIRMSTHHVETYSRLEIEKAREERARRTNERRASQEPPKYTGRLSVEDYDYAVYTGTAKDCIVRQTIGVNRYQNIQYTKAEFEEAAREKRRIAEEKRADQAKIEEAKRTSLKSPENIAKIIAAAEARRNQARVSARAIPLDQPTNLNVVPLPKATDKTSAEICEIYGQNGVQDTDGDNVPEHIKAAIEHI